ncbi:uncharacterized protein KY384_008529 [Bacidia gigantensis]|uniref:uncharacterized protein n=1 Tax=Bacidia gigantensis TaxID=2732470 RepID=UPI001D057EF7|nr:uncharacterized protein KY384_008529 [Bacidia gigantensis]KAG8527100.1 hypothetical protein KY384_008529 [Bacidia gigantensis]
MSKGSTKFQPLDDIKTILITGGAGFIGSWVTRHLALVYQESYRVICLDKLDDVASMRNIEDLLSLRNFTFVHGDITSSEDLGRAFKENNVDCVLHFAALSHVQDSFKDPVAFNVNNVCGTLTLLEAIRAYGNVKRFIHVSTDEVYGQIEDDFANESQILQPTSPYSASKAAAEMHVLAYQKSFGLPAIVVRSNNVYGPHQYPQKIIPLFILKAMKGDKLPIQGSGMHSRRYLYGADAADAFDTILHQGCLGSTYNISSTHELRNIDIAFKILLLHGFDARDRPSEYIEWVADRPFNDSNYKIDDSRLRNLGWQQKTDFDAGLKVTVEWYQKHAQNWWMSKPVPN